LRQYASELDHLRKELQVGRVVRVQKESEKKNSDLKSALERLKESDSSLQRTLRVRERVLEIYREAESSVQRACDEKTSREMADVYFSRWKRRRLVSSARWTRFGVIGMKL